MLHVAKSSWAAFLTLDLSSTPSKKHLSPAQMKGVPGCRGCFRLIHAAYLKDFPNWREIIYSGWGKKVCSCSVFHTAAFQIMNLSRAITIRLPWTASDIGFLKKTLGNIRQAVSIKPTQNWFWLLHWALFL